MSKVRCVDFKGPVQANTFGESTNKEITLFKQKLEKYETVSRLYKSSVDINFLRDFSTASTRAGNPGSIKQDCIRSVESSSFFEFFPISR